MEQDTIAVSKYAEQSIWETSRSANTPADPSKQAAQLSPRAAPPASYLTVSVSDSCFLVSIHMGVRLRVFPVILSLPRYYARPTKPKVATLMRTSGGNTVRKARKHSPAVAPVVKTSSMSKMCRNWQLSLAGCATKAPRTLPAFELTSSRVCVFVYFRLLRMSRYNATPVTEEMASAMISAWLYPLVQRRRQ